jgi:hypothetical protein
MTFHRLPKLLSMLLVLAVPALWSTTASAMPSYARQTGLDCNSCHIGFQPVPLFTRTGRLFIMRGFQQPNSVHGKFRETGFDGEGNETPRYGGNYLALNWTDFFAARFITNIASGGTNATGQSNDITTNAGSRMALFFTGPVTDWLAVWTEIGYMGNNSLPSANTTGTAGQVAGNNTNLNLFAYDEFRLTASKMVGPDSFIALAVGNEYPDAINEFVFPNDLIRPWGYGQGGVGKEYSTTAWSAVGFWKNRFLTQFSMITGDADNNWSNGHNQYVALAFNGVPGTGERFRRQSNDVWFVFDATWGNNVASQVTQNAKTSLLCTTTTGVGATTTCPAGLSDAGGFSFSNNLGSNWGSITDLASVSPGLHTAKTSTAWRFSIHHTAADHGNFSWYQAVAIAGVKQDYTVGNASSVITSSSNQTKVGYFGTIYYNRTYGVGFFTHKALNYDLTLTSSGTKYKASTPTTWGMRALWTPAMNINIVAQYSRARASQFNPTPSKASAWSLNMDFNF